MNRLMVVNFRATGILGVQLEDCVFVVLKPVVEAMGLAWNGQLERIKRDPVLREGMRIIRTPSIRGGNQDTVVLLLDRFHGWLFKVETSRVRDELRERIQLYQRECYELLCKHFLGDREQPAKEENETLRLHLNMCQEARQIGGVLAGAQMWKKLGLPMVPALDDGRSRDCGRLCNALRELEPAYKN
jgi:P22_AR N-terminal domain